MAVKKDELKGMDLQDLVKVYGTFFGEVSSLFYEREWEVKQLMYAMLIKEHVLLKGVPGTAKSMLALKIFGGIQGAEVFKNQFTRMQDDSYVFGPQMLDEFKQGKIVHNITGSLITADFAFLDEFFNASEETLVATLEPLNERTFTRPHQKEKCPLIMAIMTTNQERESEKELRAVYDRILFKSDVKEVVDSGKRMDMYRDYLSGKTQNYQPVIDFKTLQRIHSEFDTCDVQVPVSMLTVYDMVLNEYESQTSVKISPRKKNKLLNLIKASCFLRGEKVAGMEDIQEIQYGLVEGGDLKSLTFFQSVFQKVNASLANAEIIQKMEGLFESNKAEKDKGRQYKITVGLVKKCEKMVETMRNETSSAVLIPMVEGLKKKAETFLASLEDGDDSNEEIFNAGKKK